MAEDTAEELDRFRSKWQEEVKKRSYPSPGIPPSKSAQSFQKSKGATSGRDASPPLEFPHTRRNDLDEHIQERIHHDLENRDEPPQFADVGQGKHPSAREEPASALEHYERAIQRESDGSLGDSLVHYRKAFRLDVNVDRIYRNKHFPPSSFPSLPATPNQSNAAVTVPNRPPASPTSELIASFASLPIPPEDPPTDRSPASPCPISIVPFEILVNILLRTAVADVADFARLSLVCKRFAYLVATEDRIWRRICLGAECGFASMHYKWALTISGHPLPISVSNLDAHLASTALSPYPEPLPLSAAYSTYKQMLHSRPRIRFSGCYISTVNYIRPGAATASQATWNSPVMIVTYYRYLRFFRDGTCASLLTTNEPADVVRYLSKQNLHVRHAGGLPSAVMNQALRGRWRLTGNPYAHTVEEDGPEGTLHIETQGVDADKPNPKYIYKMMLQLKSAGRGNGQTRNNKLSWLGYWSYNKLTDDWCEFGLKNDRAFFWSRVKSYGNG